MSALFRRPKKAISDEQHLRSLKIVTWAMLVAAPVAYLFIANLQNQRMKPVAGNDLVFYLLFLLAVIDPPVALIIERFQISQYRAGNNRNMTPANLFFTISIIKMAFVEAVYLFGFVSFLLTGNYLKMLWFYPVGVAWTLIYWPRRTKYEDLLHKLECP